MKTLIPVSLKEFLLNQSTMQDLVLHHGKVVCASSLQMSPSWAKNKYKSNQMALLNIESAIHKCKVSIDKDSLEG